MPQGVTSQSPASLLMFSADGMTALEADIENCYQLQYLCRKNLLFLLSHVF